MNNKILWLTYLLYLLVSGFAMTRHELWTDEIHSWNLCKGSDTYESLLQNKRYEGHPPVWYTLLWGISRVTHRVQWIQVAQYVVAGLVAFIVLFYAPFPAGMRIMLCFGYYFLFEYGVLSRNYALGVLFGCCLCIVLHRTFRYRLLVYYLLLFLLSNVHMLALILAGSIHIYFLLSLYERGDRRQKIMLHLLAGALVLLPALFFIYPPSDSSLSMGFFLHRWNVGQLRDTFNAPLRALLPIPAWWEYHCWNTQFLLSDSHISRIMSPILSLALVTGGMFILRKSRKALALFVINWIVTSIEGISIFPLTDTRYAGFIFIGFILSLWMYCYESPLSLSHLRWIYVLLTAQLLGGFFMIGCDIQRPFSNLYTITGLIQEAPSDAPLVTDYWTMNSFSAFTDKPAYCIDLQQNLSFLIWGPEMATLQKRQDRYTNGLERLFREQQPSAVYMISTSPITLLEQTDTHLQQHFHVALIDARLGAIERGSDLYLYKITREECLSTREDNL